MVAFLAHLGGRDARVLKRGRGLMLQVKRQFPGVLQKMFSKSATEARSDARRIGIRPRPGETYQQLGIVDIPEEMHRCVEVFAAKLTKAIFYMKMGAPFAADGYSVSMVHERSAPRARTNSLARGIGRIGCDERACRTIGA